MPQFVRYACGDTQVIHLVSSPGVREEILQRLRHSSCPACQRKSRYEDAHLRAALAGLHPLQATCKEHLALAEIVRMSLWQAMAEAFDQDTHPLLAALFNRRSAASFWLKFRAIALPRPTPPQVGYVILSLLHPATNERRNMIRNGYARRLWAEEERTHLVERWQAYPDPVQRLLHTLLRNHGLAAAQLATEAMEGYAHPRQAPHQEKEE